MLTPTPVSRVKPGDLLMTTALEGPNKDKPISALVLSAKSTVLGQTEIVSVCSLQGLAVVLPEIHVQRLRAGAYVGVLGEK